eukprot:gene4897-8704_t
MFPARPIRQVLQLVLIPRCRTILTTTTMMTKWDYHREKLIRPT